MTRSPTASLSASEASVPRSIAARSRPSKSARPRPLRTVLRYSRRSAMSWSSSSSMERRVPESRFKPGSGRPGSSGLGEPHILRSLAAAPRVRVGLVLQLLPFGQRVEHALGEGRCVEEDLAAVLAADETEPAITNESSDDTACHGAPPLGRSLLERSPMGMIAGVGQAGASLLGDLHISA